MKHLSLGLDPPPAWRHPMDEFLRSEPAITREELLAWNNTAEAVEYALFYVEGDPDAYATRIDDVDSVRGYTVTPIDSGAFYVYLCQETRPEEAVWRRAFAERDLVVVPPIVFDDAGTHLTVVGDPADLRELVADIPEPMGVTVEAVGSYDRRHATIASGLTDRQYEAVETAAAMGYFAVPREASLAEVADRLDCAESTASKLLRTAIGRIVDRLVGDAGAHAGPVAH